MGEHRRQHAERSTGTEYTVPCPTCNVSTKHAVRAAVDLDWGDDFISGFSEYQIVECKGCETLSFRLASSNSEDMFPDGSPIESVELFPPRLVGHRPLEEVSLLPLQLRTAYQEVLQALATGSTTLAAIGMGAIVERVCVQEGAEKQGFENKVNHLVLVGRLTKHDAEYLEPVRIIRNLAAHEAAAPKIEDAQNALRVVEHLLETIYLMKARVETLMEVVTVRAPHGYYLARGGGFVHYVRNDRATSSICLADGLAFVGETDERMSKLCPDCSRLFREGSTPPTPLA